jgi:hypothetical protein
MFSFSGSRILFLGFKKKFQDKKMVQWDGAAEGELLLG